MRGLIKDIEEGKGTTIELGNIGSKAQAEKVKKVVDGKSFYKFVVSYGIMAGNYPVTVFTKSGDRKGATEMLLFLLASNI